MKYSGWQKFLSLAQLSGYIITVAALPFSNLLMSIGTIWIASACVLQWATDLVQKKNTGIRWKRFTSNRSCIALTLLYAMALLGMCYTGDISHGWWDLRMKLPLLVLPISMLTSNPLTSFEIRIVKGTFLLGVFMASAVCIMVGLRILPIEWNEPRDISIFISHIRFSLLIAFGITLAFHSTWKISHTGKLFCILYTLPLILLLYLLESVTGFVLLGALVFWLLLATAFGSKNLIWKITSCAALILLPASICIWLLVHGNDYLSATPISDLPTHTANGEAYEHNLDYPLVEDGHYVMTHIAWGELYSAWQERSIIHPDSLDKRGNQLKGTLIRYLAAKNLYKNAGGIKQLTDVDVKNVENGIANPKELHQNALARRIDRILFEYSNYRAGGDANGHSVFQRFEFWRAALLLIKKNFWTGVGTGDTKRAFAEAYNELNSTLEVKNRLRAHNQYLTHWLTYGVAGILLLIIIIVLPLTVTPRGNRLLAAFLLIAALSFLTEDTLETQAGVMFFTFFYVFLQSPVKSTLPPRWH